MAADPSHRDLCVVKLGGSLHDAPELRGWLAGLATAAGPARVVVPGGGPFADAVRAAQGRLGFGDLAAHRMAILAMQQYGLRLQDLEPRLALLETEVELRGLAPGAGGVWLPWRLAGREEAIPAGWEVTSDSLALWLARRLGAGRLVLVKSAALPGGAVTAEALAEAGVVDAAFPGLAADYAGGIRCIGREDAGLLAALLKGRAGEGSTVVTGALRTGAGQRILHAHSRPGDGDAQA